MRPQVSASRPEVSRPADDRRSGQHPPALAGPSPVRFATVAVGLSLATHAALIAGLGGLGSSPRVRLVPRPRAAVALTDAPAPLTITPIDLALVGPIATTPPTAAPPTAPPRAATAPRRAAAAPPDPSGPPDPSAPTLPAVATDDRAAGAGAGSELPGVGTPGPGDPGRGRGVLDMRRPARVDLSPRAVTARVDVAPGAPPPPRAVPSGELAPAGGGTYRSRQPGFVAKVDRDGEVSFEDEDAFSLNFPILDVLRDPLGSARELARDTARNVEDWQRDPWRQVREADRRPGVNDSAPADGTVTRNTGDKPDQGGTVPIVGGRTELTDWVMRQGGIDPYASAKRQWLDRTRDERLAIKAAAEARKLAETTRTIRAHAARVWGRTDLDAAARRAALFELWDDAAEDGPAELVEAGTAARNAIVGFVRAHLPAGGPDAYPAAELAALNARRLSRATFAPY